MYPSLDKTQPTNLRQTTFKKTLPPSDAYNIF